jgi:hypothetical protein
VAPRLKVFVTSDGLTDYAVAASSRPKALAAWGVKQDLFKEGLARETDDPALVEAATAQPGEVLRRPAGTRGELARLKPARKAKPAGPSKAQLRKVADLEARLAELDEAHRTELAELEKTAAAVRTRQDAERRRLGAALAKAREAPA